MEDPGDKCHQMGVSLGVLDVQNVAIHISYVLLSISPFHDLIEWKKMAAAKFLNKRVSVSPNAQMLKAPLMGVEYSKSVFSSVHSSVYQNQHQNSNLEFSVQKSALSCFSVSILDAGDFPHVSI